MIKNILVGYDNSRSAQVALAQAIDLAEAFGGRVHLLVVGTEEEPLPEPELAPEPGIVEMAELSEEAEELESARPLVPPFVEEAWMKLQQAHVGGSIRTTSGARPAVRLGEESHLADLVVVGRGGKPHSGSGQVGRNTRQLLQGRLLRPVLVCSSEYIAPESVLLVYQSSRASGRAISVAGELATTFNVDLDVVVTARRRQAAERCRDRVESALLAYHTEGEVVSSAASPGQALLTEGLERNPSIVVIPQPPPPTWSWQLSPLYTAALQLPDAMILVVP